MKSLQVGPHNTPFLEERIEKTRNRALEGCSARPTEVRILERT